MRFIDHSEDVLDQPRRAFRRAVEDVVGAMKDNAPVGDISDHPGQLRANLHSRELSATEGEYKAEAGGDLPYTAQREFGGTIYPRRGKYLVWRGADGKLHFARKVTQLPGGARQGHRPFIRPAGDRFPDFMDRRMAEAAR